MTKGDLIHIPQSSHLLQIDPSFTFITSEFIMDKPTPAVYISSGKLNGQPISKVYVNSDYWFVDEKCIYPLREDIIRRKYVER
jgi:hypothetical protein